MYLPAFADLAKGYRLNKKGFYEERLFLLDCIKLGMQVKKRSLSTENPVGKSAKILIEKN
jgi:hypothetical protein